MKNKLLTASAILIAAALGTTAAAQSGDLDQESPNSNAGFNLSASSLTWQAQVRAGMDGQLEGFSMYLTGAAGSSQANVAIGLGDAWSTNIVFSETITLTSSGTFQFVDTTAANIQLVAGETYVIQAQGNDTGMGCGGSYVAPPGDPLYPEPLWLNQNSFADGGWRLAFKTYMLAGSQDCLTLTVDPLVGGSSADWTVSGATPGEQVAMVYGLNDGNTSINGFAGYCATFGIQGVNQNRVICTKSADGAGNATCTKKVPAGMSGRRVLSQAAERNTCPDECVSNLDDQVIG